MLNKRIVSSSREFSHTGCTSYTADTLADMTCCGQCEHKRTVKVDEFVPLEVAMKMRDMGKRLGFKGDKFEQVDNWLKIMWLEPRCNITKLMCLPDEIMHRCPHKATSTSNEPTTGGEWWN